MHSFTLFDYAIVVIYVIASLVIGLRFSTKQKNVEDYFVADRKGKSWAVAISAIATGLSAISYLGTPAWIFEHDLQLDFSIVLLPPSMLLVAYLFVPVLSRLRVITIYEYLEVRFNLAVRTIASGLFLVLRGGWLATAIYTQALLLTELSNLPLWACVLLIGLLTAVYTVLGGMEAVLWTDVMQFFVLVGGLIAILVFVLIGFHGDAGKVVQIAHAGGRTRLFDFQFSLTQVALWGIIAFTLVNNLCTYGSDQVMVQRFLTSPSPREMRRAILFTGLLTVPVVLLLMAVGLALYSYYEIHPQLRTTLTSAQRVVPHFVGNVLPSGVAGLVVAGVFAATMSTLSAGFNSLATATVVDFVQRFRRTPPQDPTADLRLARNTTMIWALASTIAALLLGLFQQKSIVELFGAINGLFAGPILGIFLLGILFRRPNAHAAVLGIVVGTLATWAASLSSLSWLFYAPVGFVVTLVIGNLSGLIFSPATDATATMSAVQMPQEKTTS